MSRRVARLELFKIVFESEMNNILPTEIEDNFLERDEVLLTNNGKSFFVKHVHGISKYNEELNQIIEENMEGWDLKRIGSVERALLKCGTYELKYEDTGIEIVINEIVEIAKIYGEEKTSEFINGVLGKIVKKVR